SAGPQPALRPRRGRPDLRRLRHGRAARPHPAGLPGGDRGTRGPGRGTAGPGVGPRRGRGAGQDRQGAARRGGPPRQPDGGPGRGRGVAAAGPSGPGPAVRRDHRRHRPAEEIETEPSPSLSELGAVLDQVRAAGLPVEFRTGGQPAALAPGVELTAYRIVQEALTNTLKDAPASQAVVTLAYEPDFITVTVANSGPATLA